MLPNNAGGAPSRPGGDPSMFFAGLDPSSSKQLAALTAVGNARRANQGSPAGVSSGPLVGGMHQQSHSYGHASPTLGHQLQANPSFNIPPQQPDGTVLQRPPPPPMMAQNAQNAALQQHTYRQRNIAFLKGLAQVMSSRNAPLPPAITGVHVPYDHVSSMWRNLEPASEIGGIKLAGRDVDLFRLWQYVTNAGGSAKLQQQNLWSSILPMFNLPEALPQPLPDGTTSTASALATYFMALLGPFEETMLKGAAQGMGQNMNQGRPTMPPSSQPAPGLPQQLPTSMPAVDGPAFEGQVPPQTPQLRSNGSMLGMMQPTAGMSLSSPALERQNTGAGAVATDLGLPIGLDFDIDAQGRKRKVTDGDEGDGKRSRRKTGDSEQSVTPLRGEAMSASNSHLPGTPAPSSAAGGQPHRRKIEYVPLARELDSVGGRNTSLIEHELQQLNIGRPLRALEEWGRVHVDALTMSLRSRISMELSYALTTLNVLSSMRNRTPDTGISIVQCDDLIDELLDLLEESAFEGVEDNDVHVANDTPITTHRQLLNLVQEDGMSLFADSKPKRPTFDRTAEGPIQRRGDIIKIVVSIIRNFSAIVENQVYLARYPTLIDILLRLTTLRRENSLSDPVPESNAMTIVDIIAVRKDVINTLVNLAGPMQFSTSPLSGKDERKARRLFELVSAYIVDPMEAQPPIAWIVQAGLPPTPHTRAPVLTDLALEVFTRCSQPDSTRQILSTALPHEWMYSLFTSLVHRLPNIENDFVIAMRETPAVPEGGGTWQSYIERLSMALYSLAFLMPPVLKKRVREDRSLCFSRIMFRFVRRCLTGGSGYGGMQSGQESRNFFHVATRRVIECVKVIEDGLDSFDTSQANSGSNAPLLSFGVGYGEAGDNRVERGTGMWGGRREDIFWVSMCREVDELMFSEMDSLSRVECKTY